MRVEFSALFLWFLTSLSWGIVEISPPKMEKPTENQIATLRIKVKPVTIAKGKIHAGLFRDANSFPKKELAFAGKEVVVKQTGEAEIEFSGLAPGRYALAVFHDLNGNGKLDTNLLGVPTEPYGFSNINSAKWGSPDFDEAAFEISGEGRTMEIRLAFWKNQ
jgi:uncharacterized protein (DUF2141 family)